MGVRGGFSSILIFFEEVLVIFIDLYLDKRVRGPDLDFFGSGSLFS